MIKTPETLRAYTYAVRQYFTYYRDITYPNLKLYKIFLLEHYKPQTINQRIRALNAYLDFKKLYPGHLPMVKIQQKTYLDHMISEADYEYLKRCLLRDERYTYYFLIRFMAATGVRVSEVIQFQAEDIFSGYKDIYSKGNKVRRIYIPQSLEPIPSNGFPFSTNPTVPSSSTASVPPSLQAASAASSKPSPSPTT